MEWFLIILMLSFGGSTSGIRLGPYYSQKDCKIAAQEFVKEFKQKAAGIKTYCLSENKEE